MDIEVKQKEINKKIKGTLYFLLILFALLFSFGTPNSVSFGDIILNRIGLKAWSNQTQGLHYTVFYAFALFIIGYVGVTRSLNDIYPKLIRRLPAILILLVISSPIIYSTFNNTIKTFSSGINAIDYNRKTSNCNYKTDTNGNIVLRANLKFKNFSNKDVKFYIKLVPNSFFSEDIINKEPIIATNIDNNSPQQFTVYSKAVQNFEVKFKAKSKSGLISQGNMQNLDIIIFTSDQEKQFINN